MHKKTSRYLRIAGAALVPALLMAVHSYEYGRDARPNETQNISSSCSDCHSAALDDIDDQKLALAKRVQKRLINQGVGEVSLASIVRSLDERARLLKQTVRVTVNDVSGNGKKTAWDVSIARNPDLIVFSRERGGITHKIDRALLIQTIERGSFSGSHLVRDVLIDEVVEKKNYLGGYKRAASPATARPGFEYDAEKLADELIRAFSKNMPEVSVHALYREPTVIVRDERGDHALELLSLGVSDFAQSPEAREANIHKAFNEHVSNVLVAPDDIFSFNAVLDGPVTLEKGWKEALGLFGGGAAMTPGGGICQAATTVFRAAMLGGFPLMEKRNHSLYVTYYEKHGVGIDATIFPGVHDLRFRNDTQSYLLLQAYTEGTEAYVAIYGKDDGRSIALEGPFFAGTKPRPPSLRALGLSEIGWVQTITFADGTQRVKPVISTFAKPVPRSVSQTYHVQTYTDSLRTTEPHMADAGL